MVRIESSQDTLHVCNFHISLWLVLKSVVKSEFQYQTLMMCAELNFEYGPGFFFGFFLSQYVDSILNPSCHNK